MTASSSTNAGSNAVRPGWPDADQRRDDRLVRAPLGRQAHARRRRHEQELRALVAGVVQRVEAAADERVVERADRQQPSTEERAGQPQRGQEQEQVVLGDAQLDVLSGRRHLPLLGRAHVLLAEQVGARAAVEQAAAVDPRRRGWSRRSRRARSSRSGRRTRPGSRARSFRIRPNPSWVDIRDPWGTARASGTATRGGSCRRSGLRRRRAPDRGTDGARPRRRPGRRTGRTPAPARSSADCR